VRDMAYSDAEVGEALVRLAVNKYDYALTAEQTGVSESALKRWAKSEPKKGVAELLERTIERLLMVIPEHWDGRDWAIALGILLDKWLLVNGKATSRADISAVIEGLSDSERAAVIAETERILATATSSGGTESATDGSGVTGA
jgi:hypothetical protein